MLPNSNGTTCNILLMNLKFLFCIFKKQNKKTSWSLDSCLLLTAYNMHETSGCAVCMPSIHYRCSLYIYIGAHIIIWHNRVPNKTSNSRGATINAVFHVFNHKGHSHRQDSNHLNKTQNKCWECNIAAMYAYHHCPNTARYQQNLRDGHFFPSLWKLIVPRPK